MLLKWSMRPQVRAFSWFINHNTSVTGTRWRSSLPSSDNACMHCGQAMRACYIQRRLRTCKRGALSLDRNLRTFSFTFRCVYRCCFMSVLQNVVRMWQPQLCGSLFARTGWALLNPVVLSACPTPNQNNRSRSVQLCQQLLPTNSI